MHLSINLGKSLTWSMITVALLSIGLVGTLLFVQEYRRFDLEARDLKEEYLAGQKAVIKQEVDRVVDYIDYQRASVEQRLKKELKDRVDSAHAIAERLYHHYQGRRTETELKEMIREALKPIRFYDGRGYFFIYDMEGNNVLLPFSPQLEGQNLWDLQDSRGGYTIRRMTELMRQKGEGYLTWHWYKPGEFHKMAEKIGYSRVFAPFNWWIGTGEYLEDVEAEIQRQTLDRINTIRFGKDGYIFVYDFEAITLAHYKPENIGVNQWSFRDPNGIPVLQELIRRSQEENGVFLEYVATIRPRTGEPAAKLTYARAVKEWRWLVGTGVYIDEINQILAQKRLMLEDKISRSLNWIMITLVCSLLFIALVSRYITKKITLNLNGFTAFFERAATGSSVVDEQAIHFDEFKELAQAANQMIDERNKAAAAIDDLREQLNRSRKMEALGVLAGGVAHDLNNVLSAIVGYPDLILATLPEDSPQRRYIESIRDSGLKASEIVQDLLTLARRGVMQPVVLDLNGLIERYLASPEGIKLRTAHPDLRIEKRLAPDLLRMFGSPVHLQKTIMNLVANGAEAQPRGGVIRLATENRYLDQPLRGYDQVVEGEYVALCVGDEGVGIAEEDLARIFEPFFSKKNLGRSGTGLGMTVVWGTVVDHGGYINVSSVEGRGTLFELYFPATRQEVVEEAPAADQGEYKGKGESLLLVDDVPEQRELAKAMLAPLGYRVETAASGEEALGVLADHRVDLLLLDMIMTPGIDGLTTYERALALHPEQRAVIVSGYAETDRVQKAMELGARRYVKKPYTMQALAKAVFEALHAG